jgi:hypothetical protein
MPRKNPPKLTKEKTDEIGCLLMDLGFDAGEYKIFPNTHFARNMKFYEKEVNSDRFWYPPLVTTWKRDPKTQKRIEKCPTLSDRLIFTKSSRLTSFNERMAGI